MAELKHQALQIFQRTLRAIDIPRTMRRKLARSGSTLIVNGVPLDLASYRRIFAVAVGKASVAMARGLTDLLAPDFRPAGILVGPATPEEPLQGFRVIVAGHPVPNQASLEAGRSILDLLAQADERTLIFFLLSGGGSALMEQPLDPEVGLDEVQTLHRVLVTCGASIHEINAVRKHLSGVKGGRLAAAAPAATKITLGVSDVPEGCESALASGPTLPDPTSVSDACRVVERYALLGKLPAKIRARFERPESLPETPKPGDPVFRRASFQVLLGRHDLFHPAHCAAEAAGYITVCDNTTDDWPLERAANYLLQQLAELKREHPGRPAAVIADGELSSPAIGDGIGGRNSAFVLHCVPKIAGSQITVLSAGTDGIDGSSPAAGAVADGETLSRARGKGLDPTEYFERSDSYTFFLNLGDAVVTGPTGNNLRDLRILLSA